MPVEQSEGESAWKTEALKLSSRIDGLHETLEAQATEIDLLKEEVAERQKLYDALAANADAIAREVIDVMESRRPLADAMTMLHEAVSLHMAQRQPARTKTKTRMVYDDLIDGSLYDTLERVDDMLKDVKGSWTLPFEN